MKIKRIDACELDDLIKKHYGRKWGIPSYMEGQRKMTANVDKGLDEDMKILIQAFKDKKIPKWEEINTFESLLCGLCDQGELEEGEYLICFDD